MADGVVIDQDLFRTLVLSLPRLIEEDALELIRAVEGQSPAYELLTKREMRPVLEAVLDPSPERLASATDAGLRAAYTDLYRRPELSDMVWLNSFRIISARMGRHKHILAFILFIPLDEGLVSSLCEGFEKIARETGMEHDYGFLTPIDMGKRAVLEYDYYIDHTDPADKARTADAMRALLPWLDGLCAGPQSNMTWLKTVFTQGCARKESWFYRDLVGRPDVA